MESRRTQIRLLDCAEMAVEAAAVVDEAAERLEMVQTEVASLVAWEARAMFQSYQEHHSLLEQVAMAEEPAPQQQERRAKKIQVKAAQAVEPHQALQQQAEKVDQV